MTKTHCFGKGGVVIYISRFILQSKPIWDKYLNRPKYHKLNNLVLIMEPKKKLQRNNGVRNVYTFFMHILKVLSFIPQGDM